jgi:hypothetical protein
VVTGAGWLAGAWAAVVTEDGAFAEGVGLSFREHAASKSAMDSPARFDDSRWVMRRRLSSIYALTARDSAAGI